MTDAEKAAALERIYAQVQEQKDLNKEARRQLRAAAAYLEGNLW